MGYDDIYKLLKVIAPVIIKPLTLLIIQVLNTGIFPDKLKIAKVIPIYKKEIPSFSLKLGNTNIEKVDDFNYLGLTVDTNLNWKKHTEKVANRCSKKIGVLNRLKYVLPLCIKTMLYNTLILPHITYCIMVWG